MKTAEQIEKILNNIQSEKSNIKTPIVNQVDIISYNRSSGVEEALKWVLEEE